MASFPGWQIDVLTAVGAHATAGNLDLLNAWQACEGGGADFNPLNTTQPAAGATNYNSIGVKNYVSGEQGVQATVQTLRNGHYDGILADLRAGTFSGADILHRHPTEFSTWGTAIGCLASRLHTITGPAPYKNNTPSLLPPQGGLTGHPIAPVPVNVLTSWRRYAHAVGVTVPTQTRRARDIARLVRAVGYTGPSGR